MSYTDVLIALLELAGLFCLASLIAVASERWILWRRRRAIRRIMREQQREQIEWRATWSPSGDY